MHGLILHVNESDAGGGAAVAARRLVIAQRAAGMNAQMLVLRKHRQDEWVHEIGKGSAWLSRLMRAATRRALRIRAGSDRVTARTLGLVPTGAGAAIKALRPAVLHYHWLGSEMIGLAEIVQRSCPVVWTLHDQWAFCGVEHYARDAGHTDGYVRRPAADADRWNFERKRKIWKGWQPTLVCPSGWMQETAQASPIAQDWPKVTIGNTLDTAVFDVMDRAEARRKTDLPGERRIVLFGAARSDDDPRKGFDLLREALDRMDDREKARTLLVTFGGAKVDRGEWCGIGYRSLGSVKDEGVLAALYNAADVFVAPSRQDNLPNTMVEALSCGTPCVGFDIGGLGDIVADPVHGQLVPAFDVAALSDAIVVVGGQGERQRIRADAIARFGNDVIVDKHRRLYEKVLRNWAVPHD